MRSRLVWLALCTLALLPAPASAQDAVVDGARVYQQACAGCHSGGPGGFFTRAPRIGKQGWPQRLQASGSDDAFLASVRNGKGKMPPQGGANGLGDAELRAAIAHILHNSPP